MRFAAHFGWNPARNDLERLEARGSSRGAAGLRRRTMGANGIVQEADRPILRAEDITAAQIVERHLFPDNRRRRDSRSR